MGGKDKVSRVAYNTQLQLQIALGSSGGNLLAMLQCCFWDGIGSTILGWGLTGVESGSSKSGKIEMV